MEQVPCKRCKKKFGQKDFPRHPFSKSGYYGTCRACLGKIRIKSHKRRGKKPARRSLKDEIKIVNRLLKNGPRTTALSDHHEQVELESACLFSPELGKIKDALIASRVKSLLIDLESGSISIRK